MGADEVRSACAPSPHWRLEALDHYGEWERAGGVDLSVNACAWTKSDQWTFEVTQAATTGGYARSGWRARAWVVNGDGTPTYRTVSVHIRVDHCPTPGRCATDVAGFEAKMRLVLDEYTRQVITDTTVVETGSSHTGWRVAKDSTSPAPPLPRTARGRLAASPRTNDVCCAAAPLSREGST